jgi:hypothetical protein
MRKTHVCDKESDIEVIKTHIIYIKQGVDEIKTKMDKQDRYFATKRELNIHRYALSTLFGALLGLLWYLLGVK